MSIFYVKIKTSKSTTQGKILLKIVGQKTAYGTLLLCSNTR